MKMKKYGIVVFILLSIIMLFSIGNVFAAENITEFFGGDGSANNPYLIGKKEHLNNVRNYLDAHFVMVTDVSFTEEDFAEGGLFYNDGEGWISIGTETTPFSGTFNGAGKTIYGLAINPNNSTSGRIGLFGNNDGTIISLNIKDIKCKFSNVSSSKLYIGGIAAYNSGVIENCNVRGSISSSSSDYGNGYTNGCLGGISGINNGTIQTSSSQVDFEIYRYGPLKNIGGITGQNEGNIFECCNTGSVAYGKYSGGIAGQNKGVLSECYNTGNVAYSNFSGAIAGNNENIIQNCFNIGTIRSNDSINAGGICGINSGTVSASYNAGMVVTAGDNPLIYESTGTITDCYYYSCSLDYGEFQNGLSKEQMQEKQTFSGFDFSNVWEFDESSVYHFPVLKNVKKISFSESNHELFGGGLGIFSDPYIISTPEHFNNIKQYPQACYILTNNILISAATWDPSILSGGIDGNGNTITINGSRTLTSNVSHYQSSDQRTYGIFLTNYGLICNLNVRANFSVILDGHISLSIGGISSSNSGVIRDCKISGSLNVNETDRDGTATVTIGGIAGRNFGNIKDCINSSAIKADTQSGCVGGITGYSESGSIIHCINTGKMIAYGYRHGSSIDMAAGGITGEIYNAIISNCRNDGEITASGSTYKLSGYGYSSVILNAYAGGIAGKWEPPTNENIQLIGKITMCTNNGNISATVSTGNVPTAAKYAFSGGICGIAGYTLVNKNMTVYLSQARPCSISLCRNNGTAEHEIVDQHYGDIECCYSISDGYKVWGTTAGKVHTEPEMRIQETYSGFDFENDWIIIPGSYPYPQLRNDLDTPVKSIYIAQQPSAPLECVNGHFISYNGLKVGILFEDGISVVAEPWPECFSLLDINSKDTHSIPLTVLECKTDDVVNIIVRDKLLTSIAVETQPAKTRYFIDEETIDTNGASLKLIYDDTSSEIVEISPKMISGFTPGKIGLQILTVTYDSKSCPLEITVYDVIGISVETLPTKTTYVQGQEVSGTGGVFSTIFSDGLKKEYSMELATLVYPKNSTGEVQATVSYLGYTTTFTITVNKRVVKSIKIETEPIQNVYYVGQNINLNGGVIKVIFESDDNYFELIPMSTDMISGFDNSKVGYPTITVTYGGLSDEFLVRVREFKPENMTIKMICNKKEYSYNNQTKTWIDENLQEKLIFETMPTSLELEQYLPAFVAAYDDNDVLIWLDIPKSISYIFSANNNKKINYYKIFFFSYADLRPLRDYVTIQLNK